MRGPAVGLLLLSLGPACSPTTTPPAASVAPEPAPSALLDADWGRFRSQRYGLSVPLPEGETWRIDDRSSRWLDALHTPTETRLRARTWLEPRPVNRAHCEAEARRFASDLPVVDEQGVIEDKVTDDLFAPDFSSRLIVGMGNVSPDSDKLEGYVMAYGASGRRCVAMVFTARSKGPKGSATLGERLELGTRIAENTLYVSRLPSGPLEPLEPPAPRSR